MAILVLVILVVAAFFLALGYLIDYRFMFRRPEISDLQGRRNYLRGCSPFEFGSDLPPGGGAVLVIHGIAGSSAQMKEMSARLAAEGCHVYGVTLPGHGTDHEDLYGITWQRWYSHLDAEYERVRERHGKVSVIGFSLGAALGLRLALEHADDPGGGVDRLVLISAGMFHFNNYIPTGWLLKVGGVFASSARCFPKRLPETEDGPDYLIYKRIPLDALCATVELVHENKPRLGDVTAPVLIVHSMRDVASRPRSARYIFDRLGSETKRLVWFEDAPHGLMHGSDDDKRVLHHELVEFLG